MHKMNSEFLTFAFPGEGISSKGTTRALWARRLQDAIAAYHTATGSDPALVAVHPKLRQAIEEAEAAAGVSLPVETCPGILVWELWLGNGNGWMTADERIGHAVAIQERSEPDE